MGEFFFFMIPEADVFILHTQIKEPFFTEGLPVIEPFQIGPWRTEEFQFHLFKFPGSKDKVSGCDLVTEEDLPTWAIPKALFLRVVR